MPAPISDVLAECDRLLDPGRFEDYCVNGLQVPGGERVSTLATGVSAQAELFELAAAERAELLIVHHGLLWGSGVRAIDSILARRLRILFDARIALAAYHLPLDAHPQLGNNALLARALGAEGELEPFALHAGRPIGFIATLPGAPSQPGARTGGAPTQPAEPGQGHPTAASEPAHPTADPGRGLPAAELFSRVHAITDREPLIFDAGPQRVGRVAIVSGAGADYLGEAAAAGADALLTGEISERSMAEARERELHLIAAGHYATETFGVRRLGDRLAERFGLRHVFLDVPNPV